MDNFEVFDSIKLDKNVDRLVPIGQNQYLTAAYHLNKESGTKTGEICFISITDDLK